MRGQIRVTGIVLADSNVGEYDKRIVILTREQGRITAFARRARMPRSPLIAVCQPFVYGTFTLYAGKNYNLESAEVEDYFSELRDDIYKLYTGFYFCEMVDYFTVEGQQDIEILRLLYVSLSALRRGRIDYRLVRIIFEIKILQYFGLMMEASACTVCGRKDSKDQHILTHFSAARGGTVCRDCATSDKSAKPISGTALYTIQYILSQKPGRLYHFEVKPEILSELSGIIKDYYREQVGHSFHSLEFLEMLPGYQS